MSMKNYSFRSLKLVGKDTYKFGRTVEVWVYYGGQSLYLDV